MATDRENGLLRAAYATGITSPRELANFMGQVGHESSGLQRLEESFNYTRSASQVSSKVRSALRQGPEALEEARLEALKGRPESLAELMYGGRMGNDAPGDGYRYRGRGYIQLTGKDQYEAAGKALDLDLVKHPELAASPENASRIATWYWQENVPAHAKESVRAAAGAINGEPPNGMTDRQHRFERWERDLTPELMNTLAQGRLGQPVPPPATPTQHAGGSTAFQSTVERMLPSHNGVKPLITGHYGEHRAGRHAHGGTDFNYQGGQAGLNLRHPTVHAPIAGTVTFAGGDYGTVKIRDAQGNSHEILHLDSRSVKEGQSIQAGQPIGTMGGRGPEGRDQYAQHVHYQLRDGSGKTISPETFWNERSRVDDRAPEVGHPISGDTLRHGDRNPQVAQLQQSLNRLGVRDGNGRPLAEDGRFGDNTREAVLAFQKQHGLREDGVVGRDTRGRLATAEPVQAPAVRAAAGPQLGDPAHPDSALHGAIRARLPSAVSNEVAAHVTLQAKQSGIDSAEKVQSVVVQDGRAFVMGTTPGFRTAVDLNQPAPPLEHTSAQLLAGRAQQSVQEEQQRVVMGAR